MKNILVLTPIYPAKDIPKESTPVVHYFTKEWVKLGYTIVVIHYIVNFPKIVYTIAKPFQKKLSSFFGSHITTNIIEGNEFNIDGVNVKRIPMLKYLPHSRYSNNQINNAYNATIDYCEKHKFIPDVITSHWINPQLEIMALLKEHYKVPTCFVSHDTGRDLKTIYKNEATQLVNSIDVFGFRSEYIKSQFEKSFAANENSFLCYSGIPKDYINIDQVERKFDKINSFIFIGTLIKRKYPAAIIKPIYQSYLKDDFKITYIGEGAEEKAIKKQVLKYNISDKVFMLGKLDRVSVIDQLNKHDVFIMISKNEAFGLVYLEAMAVGCIVIASKNEGFDGIIKHGYNGFLCEAGNEIELELLINEIKSLSPSEISIVSRNAMDTASQLTDDKVAVNYIDSIIKRCS